MQRLFPIISIPVTIKDEIAFGTVLYHYLKWRLVFRRYATRWSHNCVIVCAARFFPPPLTNCMPPYTQECMRKKRLISSTKTWVPILALLGIGLITTGKAAGEITDDGVPAGMVAHVSGGMCPAGWIPAANVEGRIVVAVADGKDVGVQVGMPLGDQEDREHTHAYKGNIALTAKSIAAADGANQEGAQAQSYMLSGTTNPGPSGLGFVQVTACVKQ